MTEDSNEHTGNLPDIVQQLPLNLDNSINIDSFDNLLTSSYKNISKLDGYLAKLDDYLMDDTRTIANMDIEDFADFKLRLHDSLVKRKKVEASLLMDIMSLKSEQVKDLITKLLTKEELDAVKNTKLPAELRLIVNEVKRHSRELQQKQQNNG